MNEFNAELIEHEKGRLEKIADEVDQYLTDPEAIDALKQSVKTIANQIGNLYTTNPGKEFTFVVGGKSRRLTETMP